MDGPATQTDDLTWLEGDVPASRRYADPFYSPTDGLAETRHVFLDAPGLAGRMAGAADFHIAELGFGAGLNLLAAWALWREAGAGTLRFTSFEAHPIAAADIARAHRPWPALAPLSQALTAAWSPDGPRFHARLDRLDLTVIFGDARETVPAWEGRADVWFLDGFAPSRNPEMWTPELMRAVHARTRSGGAAVTYSAAGAVRRALSDAGFAVEKRPGFARKRHMTLARR